MRIGVSEPHGTGKTTLVEALCGRLTDHLCVDEPYVLLEEEGYEFEYPPSLADYRAQLSRSLQSLRAPAPRVVFDRTPLDFLAYLAAYGVDVEAEIDTSVLRAAFARLDLLVIVPITADTERRLPTAEMPELRRAVDDVMLDLVYTDLSPLFEDVTVIELDGSLADRVDAVLAALR
ncbi:AAA family ATPase [Nocardia noduli]|uniref:AAA family ATPase n=1 Tax=Nocardia noduli TaxID=2815722 RepID=UPI001C24E1CD|nr:AAA family ATPase [Nocardia noduli]